MTALGAGTKLTSSQIITAGGALVGVGAAIGAVGAAGLSWLNSATNVAADYANQVAYTATQVDNLGISQQRIADIGRNVARDIPVPFQQVQKSLYDIFSSMDVSASESEALLRTFAKASVAGNTDIQTAGRATIAVLNGLQLPVTDVNRVQDIMFKTVQKGVLEYSDLATSIGRVIPSAHIAGQTIETVGGSIAFLTRNGLSAAMASTSLARAFDAITNTKVAAHMHALGVEVSEGTGVNKHFRQLNDIMTDLGHRFKGDVPKIADLLKIDIGTKKDAEDFLKQSKDMFRVYKVDTVDAKNNARDFDTVVKELQASIGKLSEPDRAAALTAIFKGAGGTIQARRAINEMVTGYDELNKRVGEMNNASGSLEGAYKKMANTPAAKIQQLSNHYKLLKEEIGNNLLPVKMKLVDWLTKLVDKFEHLSPATKQAIAVIAVLVSGGMLLVGALTALAGVIIILNIALVAMGVAGGLAALPWLPIIAGIAALVAIALILIHNWTLVKEFWNQLWASIKAIVGPFAGWLYDTVIEPGYKAFITAWKITYEAIKPIIDTLKDTFMALGHTLFHLGDMFRSFGAVIVDVWHTVSNALDTAADIMVRVINDALNIIKHSWSESWQVVMNLWHGFQDDWHAGVQAIQDAWQTAWQAISDFFGTIWDGIKSVFRTAMLIIVDAFLGFIELFLKGAAAMFGWVPGIGPKLREAAASFEEFRNNVNAALSGIKDKNIIVTVDGKRITELAGGADILIRSGFRARGGPVSANMPYIVGEKGPELFIPGVSGGITPNNQLGGVAISEGAVQVTIQGNVDSNVAAMLAQTVHDQLYRLATELKSR